MTKHEAESLATKSQDALRNVVAILDAIKGGMDPNAVFFEIGRATMTAKLAVKGDIAPETPFKVDDVVNVLNPFRLKANIEEVKHTGRIRKITFQTDGTPLYWIEGYLTAQTARVLRAAKRELCTACDGTGDSGDWRALNCERCGGSGKELR